MAEGIKISNLEVIYRANGREFIAVRDFNLKIAAGELVCLIGPSGCGKTTVINTVAGFVQASNGQILVNGRTKTAPGPDRGVVFQDFHLFPWLNVFDNVRFGPRMTGQPKSIRDQCAQESLDLVHMAEFWQNYPHELSGGMQQRVAIARALCITPRMLLLDEPFGSLDAQTRLELQLTLQRLRTEAEMTILFVTHDIDEAIILGDRICVLTSAPAQIREEFKNPFEFPRQPILFDSSTYGKLKRNIFSVLRDNVGIN